MTLQTNWDPYENDEKSMDLSIEKDIFQVQKKYITIGYDIFLLLL